MKIQSIGSHPLLGFVALLVAACASQSDPANKAIEDIISAEAAALPDADKYIPDQVASLQHKVADLNASFDKKDYAAVLAAAPAVLAEAKGLGPAVATKKEELAKALAAEWAGLSASVPQLLTSLKTHLNALSKAHRVPRGIDLGAAKSALGNASAHWDKAQSAFRSNQIADAVAAAKDAKAKAEAGAAALKMG